MKNRIEKTFLDKNKKLITFVTGGDPNYKSSVNIVLELAKSGADIIEIGMPFSDPMADGPTIQLSNLRSIKANINLNKIFSLCREFRKFNTTLPLILMGYYNPIFSYGDKKFIKNCAISGVDGLIIVDLQPEYDDHLMNLCKKNNIEFIRLITPTTDKSRLKTILSNASGFLYYVSITGITGQNSADTGVLKSSINRLKKETNLPILAGFGIKTKRQAKIISKFSDGIIVGSSIIKIIEKNITNKVSEKNGLKKINKYVSSLSRVIK